MNIDIMKIIFDIFTLLLYTIIGAIPFIVYLYFNKRNFAFCFIISTILSIPLIGLGTYWSEELSTHLLFQWYHFNPDGLSETERYLNVSEENRATISELYERSFGIGWTLKVLFAWIFFTIYNIAICLILKILKNNTKNNS